MSGCQSQVFSGKLKSNGKTFQSNDANRRFVDRRFGYIGPGGGGGFPQANKFEHVQI